MKMNTRHALVGIATVSLLALAACGGGTKSSESASGGFGKCEVTGEAGSVSLHPVTPGVLTVQTSLPSPGWWQGSSPENIDGGYEYCLAANIAHLAGLKSVKVANVSFDALVAGQTKDYDIAMAQISITDARKKVVQFSSSYFDSNIGVLAKGDAGVTQDNLTDKQVGTAVGTTSTAFVKGALNPAKSQRVFQDTDSMVTAVAAGQIDAALQDTAIMLGFAKQSNGVLEVVGQYKTGEQYGALYPKDSTNATAMNSAIDTMKTDGTLASISKMWLGPAFGGDPAKVPFFTAE